MPKTYTFTDVEVLAIQYALDYYWYAQQKDLKPESPLFIRMQRAVRSLSIQFKQDVFEQIVTREADTDE